MLKIRSLRIQSLHLSTIAFYSLWIFIFCVPWEEEVAMQGGIAVSHLIGAATGAVGLLTCLVERRIRKPSFLHLLFGGLVAWSGLTYFWSVAPELTAVRVGSYVQLLLMIWLIWEFAPNESRQLALVQAYVLGSYVSALSIIYSFVTGTGDNLGIVEGRYSASGFNENEIGIILALSLGMSCYLLAKNAALQAIWLFHLPVAVLAICLTGSRGSFLATLVALLMLPFGFANLSATQKRFALSGLVLIALSGIAFVPEPTWKRIGSIGQEVSEGTLTKRTYIWDAGLAVCREHPIAGVGAGAFGASVYSKLDIPYVAHNSYLSVLVELGAVGAILFLALLAGLFWSAARLPSVDSRGWIILLLTWAVAVFSVTWEHRKPTWFLFGLLIAQAAVHRLRPVPALAVTLGSSPALRQAER